MGTRCLTFVYDYVSPEEPNPLICMYRQFDGYPEVHGCELAEFLNSKTLINGIQPNQDAKEFANGMSCLAAQLVSHFKVRLGGIYLMPTDTIDADQDFEYHVYDDSVIVKDYKGRDLFVGSWEFFSEFCFRKEAA